MINSINLLASILNFSKSITDVLYRRNLSKKDIEEIITKFKLNESVYKEKIFVVLGENQELIYNESKDEIKIRNYYINQLEFTYSLVEGIVNKFENTKRQKINYSHRDYMSISKKW